MIIAHATRECRRQAGRGGCGPNPSSVVSLALKSSKGCKGPARFPNFRSARITSPIQASCRGSSSRATPGCLGGFFSLVPQSHRRACPTKTCHRKFRSLFCSGMPETGKTWVLSASSGTLAVPYLFDAFMEIHTQAAGQGKNRAAIHQQPRSLARYQVHTHPQAFQGRGLRAIRPCAAVNNMAAANIGRHKSTFRFYSSACTAAYCALVNPHFTSPSDFRSIVSCFSKSHFPRRIGLRT